MTTKRIEKVYGDCLEAVGLVIPDGGIAIVDTTIFPEIGDLVHCKKVRGALSSYIKQVKSIDGSIITVGTAYLDKSRDFQFIAEEVIGVITECYDTFRHNLVYDRRSKK